MTSTQLTASELHTLVNGEYTMPDGSRRRGLWVRVPDCQSHMVRFMRSDRSRWECWADAPGVLGMVQSWHLCQTEVAEALIRVAIEDWLADNLLGAMVLDSQAAKGGYSVAYLDRHEWEMSTRGRGPSMLQALVAAAHEQADALGIPR